MKVGLSVPLGAPYATPEYVTALGREAEARGFDSVWLGEHVVTFDEYEHAYPYSPDGRRSVLPGGLLEPLTALSFLAAVTTRLRLSTGVLVLAQRNPVVSAYQLATVDWLSSGRLNVGIGLNWCREEYEALGVPWEDRGARTDEYVEVVRRLLRDDVAEFSGRFYELPPCRLHARPVQRPHPPFYASGNTDAALRRVARLGQGWYAYNLDPDQLAERVQTLARFLDEAGRSPGDVDVTVLTNRPGHAIPPHELVPAYGEAGADRIVLIPTGTTVDDLRAHFDTLQPYVEGAQRVPARNAGGAR